MAPGGRSTGCKTCRLRHLKCDELRPNCRRCEKGGFECRGYDTIELFVDERSKIVEREKKSRQPRTRNPDQALVARPRTKGKAQQEKPTLNVVKPHQSHVETPAPFEQALTLRYSSPIYGVLPLDENEICLTFMRNRLAKNAFVGNLSQRTFMDEMPRWAWLVPTINRTSWATPLQLAIQALARAWFARLHGQPQIAIHGRECYGKALRELKTTISSSEWRQRDVLVASMCLIVYEAVEATVQNAWTNHARGLAKLIEALGPEEFQDDSGIGIFRGMRMPIIMTAIIDRTTVFLERDEWINVPWQRTPQSKNETDYLFDLFTKLPRICVRLREREADHSIDAYPVLEDVLSLLHQACQWRWDFETQRPAFAWINPYISCEPADVFPHAVEFASVFDSHALSNYSALFITLLFFVRRLKVSGAALLNTQFTPPLPAGLVKSNPLHLPGIDKMDIKMIAYDILQVMRFRIGLGEANNAAFGLFLPARVAWIVFRHCPAEEAWLSEVAQQFEQITGLQFTKLSLWDNHWVKRQAIIQDFEE